MKKKYAYGYEIEVPDTVTDAEEDDYLKLCAFIEHLNKKEVGERTKQKAFWKQIER